MGSGDLQMMKLRSYYQKACKFGELFMFIIFLIISCIERILGSPH